MKKIFCSLLLVIGLVAFIGCANNSKTNTPKKNTEKSNIQNSETSDTIVESTESSSETADKNIDSSFENQDTPTFDVLSKDDLDMLDWEPYRPKAPTDDVLSEELSIIAYEKSYNKLYNRVKPSEFTWFVNTYLDTPGFDILFITLVSDKENRDTLMLTAIKDGPDSYAIAESNVNDFLKSSDFQECIKGYYKNEKALSNIRGLTLKACWADYVIGQPIS